MAQADGLPLGPEQQFALLSDAARDYAMLLLDEKGVIRWWDSGAERMASYRTDEVDGRGFGLLFGPDGERAARLLARARDGGRVMDEAWLVRADGSRFRAVLTIRYVGDAYGYGVVIRDITAQVRAEAKLRSYADELARSNRDLEQFAAAASHDLKSPLTAVMGYAEMLVRSGRLDETTQTWAQRIRDCGAQMGEVIDALLAYARADQGEFRPAEVDAAVALNDALVALEAARDAAGAQVIADGLPRVIADRRLLSLVFQNLVANAIKFRHPERSPVVEVASETRAREWVFSVRDNGIGVPADEVDRVFEMFSRASGAAGYPGTGIGLAICQKIVARHGGRIWVDPLDDGALFGFSLPIPDIIGSGDPDVVVTLPA